MSTIHLAFVTNCLLERVRSIQGKIHVYFFAVSKHLISVIFRGIVCLGVGECHPISRDSLDEKPKRILGGG